MAGGFIFFLAFLGLYDKNYFSRIFSEYEMPKGGFYIVLQIYGVF